MTKEINLQIPDSLFSSLTSRAKKQGVSIEALCVSLLANGNDFNLVEPSLYSFMSNGEMREELQKVIQSELPASEIRSRVVKLKTQIARCIR